VVTVRGRGGGASGGGGPAPTPAPAALLRLSELRYRDADEYVKIVNLGTAPQDMTGWKLKSEVGDQTFSFPAGYTLSPGASVYVHSGLRATNSPPMHLLWTRLYVWRNNGDSAILVGNTGAEVHRIAYGDQLR